jgi:hypothetical protein
MHACIAHKALFMSETEFLQSTAAAFGHFRLNRQLTHLMQNFMSAPE